MMKTYDISTEDWRTYVWPNGDMYRISTPIRLYISTREDGSKSHRVVSQMEDSKITHYITDGWIAIMWEADPEVSF